jgi:hypothetical protein
LMGELSPLTFIVNTDRYMVSPTILLLRFECVQLNQCCSLITCLFFSCGFILPVFTWFCLLSPSVCRIPCRVFCSGGLVVIYCFNFCLL